MSAFPELSDEFEEVVHFQRRVVAGAANDQSAASEHGEQRRKLGILYAPDFIIDACGLINVRDELRGYDRDGPMRQAETADRFALERIERVRRLRRILVPAR